MSKILKREIHSYKGRKMPLWLKIVLGIFLAGAVIFALLLGQVLGGARDELRGEPNAMIILGCQVKPWGPSILLQDRLDEALEYLADHPDMLVVVSGGQGSDEPTSEAQAMADYLEEHGFAPENILLEDRSHNTMQNFAYSKEVLEQQGYDLEQGVLVVSNGFHLTRARMLAGRAGFVEVSTLAAPSSHLPSRLHMYIREPLALVKSFLFDKFT